MLSFINSAKAECFATDVSQCNQSKTHSSLWNELIEKTSPQL